MSGIAKVYLSISILKNINLHIHTFSAFKVTLFPHKASPKDLSPKSESEFVDQVSAKLKVLEQQQKAAAEVTQQVNHNNNHLEISATVKLSPKSQPSR